MPNTASVRRDLASRNLRPNKLLGQHFLTSSAVLARIVEAAELSGYDTVLEVGPGTGVLTEALAARVRRVVAVEKDPKLAALLRDRFADRPHVEVVDGDILSEDLGSLGLTANAYKIVADIPYYLTARLLRQLLESPCQPSSLTLLVQREVAHRMSAIAPQGNLLAAAVQYYATPKVVMRVSRDAFYPKPKVESAVITLKIDRKFDEEMDSVFFKNLRRLFASPRKQLVAILSKLYDRSFAETMLNKLSIKPTLRPQELSMTDIEKLTKQMY